MYRRSKYFEGYRPSLKRCQPAIAQRGATELFRTVRVFHVGLGGWHAIQLTSAWPLAANVAGARFAPGPWHSSMLGREINIARVQDHERLADGRQKNGRKGKGTALRGRPWVRGVGRQDNGHVGRGLVPAPPTDRPSVRPVTAYIR